MNEPAKVSRTRRDVPPPFVAMIFTLPAWSGEGDFRTLITDAFEGLLFVVLLKCAPIDEVDDPDVVETGVTGGP